MSAVLIDNHNPSGEEIMLVSMRLDATDVQVAAVAAEIRQQGLEVCFGRGTERVVLGCLGRVEDMARLANHCSVLPGVDRADLVSEPYKLASREVHKKLCGREQTVVNIGGVEVGSSRLWICAGPCTVESEQQLNQTAAAVKELGAHALRGGADKPRTSPYSFQGLGDLGLILLARSGRQFQLPVVTEVLGEDRILAVQQSAQVLQVGARNMQNYPLLVKLGQTRKPVLLKRHFSATLVELLLAAEYILKVENSRVVLCLRGVRSPWGTKEPFTPDISDVAQLKRMTHLPVIFDPSHATGKADQVIPMARAAVAAGADGLLVEVHPDPTTARCDHEQQLTFEQFGQLMREIKPVAEAVGRTL